MHRASVFAIVLTLAAGPSAGALCKAWCDPAESAATGCHHQEDGTSASVIGIDDCGSVVIVSSAILVKEDALRSLFSTDTKQPAVVPRYLHTIATREGRPGDEPGGTWPFAQRPLVTALRI